MSRAGWLALLAAVALVCMLLSLSAGSIRLDWMEIFSGNASRLDYQILFDLRLPRVIDAFTTGALLAVSGALMQVLLRNPLADPYVLGLSGGASVMALLAMLAGAGSFGMTGGAFCGAMISMLLVFGLAGFGRPARLVLTGVALAAGWGALVTLLLSISPERDLRGMIFWLAGNLDHSSSPYPGIAGLVAALIFALPVSRDLNLLSRGEETAASLGVEVMKLRVRIYFLCALLTSIAVMTAGSIGFVGLIVPHALRLLAGSDHRLVIPGSMLAGGILLVSADTLARTVIAPQQLPAGVVMALLGVPMFLYLVSKKP
ncbi:MAG: iron ABC transporter permease [Burkholderiales bacterium]|nr:iron ABC transporter permease [Burkholderiales bacterium]